MSVIRDNYDTEHKYMKFLARLDRRNYNRTKVLAVPEHVKSKRWIIPIVRKW